MALVERFQSGEITTKAAADDFIADIEKVLGAPPEPE
jgi:hypothetical protein